MSYQQEPTEEDGKYTCIRHGTRHYPSEWCDECVHEGAAAIERENADTPCLDGIGELRAENASLRASLSAARAEIEGMRGERDQMKRIADKFQDDYVQARAERDALDKELREAEKAAQPKNGATMADIVRGLKSERDALQAAQTVYADQHETKLCMLRNNVNELQAEASRAWARADEAEAARDRAVAALAPFRDFATACLASTFRDKPDDYPVYAFNSAPILVGMLRAAVAALSPTPATGKGDA